MTKHSLFAKSILVSLAVVTVACGNGDRSAPAAASSAAPRVPLLSRPFHPRSAPAPASMRASARAKAEKRAAAHRHDAAGADAGPAIPARYQAFAAAFDQEAAELAAPGAAVAILEHGHVAFTHAYGTVGMNSAAPVDANTIFRVGGMTEPLTAAAALALVDRGKASLSAAVPTLVPGVTLSDPRAASLTLRELLSEQSGLYDFTNFSADQTLTAPSCATDPASLNAFVTEPVFGNGESFVTSPGIFFTPSNPNFILVGAAIEQQTGAFFTDAMRTTLFAPLGMSRTFFLPSDVVSAGNYADGLTFTADGSLEDVPPAGYDCAAYRPFGYAFSSVTDYAKFAQLLIEGNPNVLSHASRRAMESPQAPSRDLGTMRAEGYGLTVSTGYVSDDNVYYPTRNVSAVGQVPGFVSSFYAFPETGFGIVTLANMDGAPLNDSIALAIKSFGALPAPAPLPKSTFAVPSRFARYAGTYESPPGSLGRIVVSAAPNGEMTIDFPDADAVGFTFWPQLSPVLNDSFLVTFFGFPHVLEFLPDSTGKYDYLLIDDLYPATRVLGDGGP